MQRRSRLKSFARQILGHRLVQFVLRALAPDNMHHSKLLTIYLTLSRRHVAHFMAEALNQSAMAGQVTAGTDVIELDRMLQFASALKVL